MDREVVAASWAGPAATLGGDPVEAPDEDAFTLTCAAVGALSWGPSDPPLERARVLGAFPGEGAADLEVALGVSGLKSSVGPASPLALRTAWTELSTDAGVGSASLVLLGLRTAPTARGGYLLAGALALGFARRSGLRLAPEGGSAGAADVRGMSEPRSPQGSTDQSAASESSGAFSVSSIYELFHSVTSDEGRTVSPWFSTEDVSVPFVLERNAAIESHRTLDAGPSQPFVWTPESLTRRAEVEPMNVSEGAYVPWTTYRDQRPSRWRLAADACPACGHLTFPVRGRCQACGNETSLVRREASRRGLLVEAATVVHRGAQPTEFDRQAELVDSYEVVVAKVVEGFRVTLQVTDSSPGTIRIGDRVDAVLRRLIPMEGKWRYGLKAVPSPQARPVDRPAP